MTIQQVREMISQNAIAISRDHAFQPIDYYDKMVNCNPCNEVGRPRN